MTKVVKYETYRKHTAIFKDRIAKINSIAEGIAKEAVTGPLKLVQIRSLSTYLNELKKRRNDFESLFQKILETISSDEAPESSLSKDLDDINDGFVQVSCLIESLLPTEDPKTPSSEGFPGLQVPTVSHVKLPKLALKTFNGDAASWISFINLYDTSIHHHSALSATLKFQYLLSVLSGEPLSLISSLSITPANYATAYNLLRTRYHNPRRLCTLHLNAILDLPHIGINNTKGLRSFVSLFFEHSRSLQALGSDINFENNPVLSAVVLRKMDPELCKKLESYRTSNSEENIAHTLPSLKDIIDFLNLECVQTEDANLHASSSAQKADFSQHTKISSRQVRTSESKPGTSKRNVSLHATQATKSTSVKMQPCFVCNQTGHKVYNCTIFKNKMPQQRFKTVKAAKHCVNCLGDHEQQNCKSKNTCFKCQKKHHTMLHFEKFQSSSRSPSPRQRPTQVETPVVTLAHNSKENDHSNYTVLLGTALVQLTASNGRSHVFRALLDSGSMINFINSSAANLLGGAKNRSSVQISGISHTSSNTKGYLNLKVTSLSDYLITPQEPFHVLDKISANLPRHKLSPEVFEKVKAYTLADPTFHLPGCIDVLIGGSLFPYLFKNEVHRLGYNLPCVVGTHFGHVVMGTAPCADEVSITTQVTSLLSTSDDDLHTRLQDFWQLEEPPTYTKQTNEDKRCDEHYAATHARDPSGRYIVRLPFKDNIISIGSSRQSAERRLYALECKFATQPEFSNSYHDFMAEYASLGHMVRCSNVDLKLPHYFLPHHGVFKNNSTTTKLRTVFDASNKTSTGLSLNDILLTGPKLQTNICDILLHFRSFNIVFSCDIRQMYRQILVHPNDRPYQLILWRESPQKPISTFELTTVTYGMNSSPYLAIRTLHQLSHDEGDAYPEAAQILRTQTYIDDVISGADSEEEALQLQAQLICLLQKGGFELRKWVSNSSQLLKALPEGHLESPVFLQSSEQPHYAILGLHWSPDSDCFTYNINLPADDRPTKRSVLSLIAKIYDPCGFLAPAIMLAKTFMQILWTLGLTWDEPLKPDLAEKWLFFVAESTHLSKIAIPRAFQITNSHSVELHGFADASESGYAAIIYLRSHLKTGDVIVRLVMAKTRVAPLKRVTLPRLELCAAHLLALLMHHCKNLFCERFNVNNIFLWSDSTVVLTWLRTPPYRLKTYVANRVAQTQELVRPEAWRHVSSGDNPADCASRGIHASQLVDHPLWWSGPTWLRLPPTAWPASAGQPVDLDSTKEVKQTPFNVFTTTQREEWAVLHKFSSWTKLQRVLAYVLRFLNNCRQKERQCGPLQLSELISAKKIIFKQIQQASFNDDIKLLNKRRECSLKLRRLNPFIDGDGLLRVGGRLSQSLLEQDAKTPIILPKSHNVTGLLIDYYHVSNLHAGPQLTQALLTQEVWIINARSAIRSRIYKCITCFRAKPRNQSPLMGDLPKVRITQTRPFLASGMDYAGPITAKVFNLRAAKHIKTYLCIFVCTVTKAVHLELVTDQTTEAFIAALTRFVSRRGLCTDLYSDCGTTFIGADAALRHIVHSLNHDNIISFAATKGIKFHFNPPAAPHQGGLWESTVKSAKYHLRRVMGESVLSLEELITLITRIEAMLNSRPLTPLSSDPTDVTALTPGHFLVGAPLTALPENDLSDIPTNRLRRWQLVQALYQRIWRRWQLEYLHTLQQRSKWTRPQHNLQVGDLVLVHTPTSSLSWPLARITKIHPGSDGAVRVVELQTATGTFKRPSVKVFRLPTD